MTVLLVAMDLVPVGQGITALVFGGTCLQTQDFSVMQESLAQKTLANRRH